MRYKLTMSPRDAPAPIYNYDISLPCAKGKFYGPWKLVKPPQEVWLSQQTSFVFANYLASWNEWRKGELTCRVLIHRGGKPIWRFFYFYFSRYIILHHSIRVSKIERQSSYWQQQRQQRGPLVRTETPNFFLNSTYITYMNAGPINLSRDRPSAICFWTHSRRSSTSYPKREQISRMNRALNKPQVW